MFPSVRAAWKMGLLCGTVGLPCLVGAWGQREVRMAVRGPECGMEVVYRRSWDRGRRSETYTVHAEQVEIQGIPCYQSISVYPDRVRRISMRASDLTPVVLTEKWNHAPRLLQRVYSENQVQVLRRGLPYPMNEWLPVPPGVHDPESFAFLLKGYPFEDQDTIAPINVLVAEPNPIFSRPRTFAVYIIPHGEERITVPAGTFDCYVLEMTLAGILGYLVPDNRFWLLKADPHLIVKAQGAGEVIELIAGPFPCDGQNHCLARAEVPELAPGTGSNHP